MPGTVCWQYNVWFSLGNLLELFGKLSGVMDPAEAKQVHALLLRRAPDAIRATKEKVLLFKKPDASFSYLKNETSWVSQNAPVAVRGTNEGDVNATIICSAEILHKIYRALGMVDFMVPLYDETDTKEFLAKLKL